MDTAEGDSAQQFQTGGNHREHGEAEGIFRQMSGGLSRLFTNVPFISFLCCWFGKLPRVRGAGQAEKLCSLLSFSLVGEICLGAENKEPQKNASQMNLVWPRKEA